MLWCRLGGYRKGREPQDPHQNRQGEERIVHDILRRLRAGHQETLGRRGLLILRE